ncbi:MAG: glutathione peroxidase [Bdellovibrionales bacterium]|jgi:glutathione peroxidase|nr:glutathione peroxidase [Bdellovibrionales bacterium]
MTTSMAFKVRSVVFFGVASIASMALTLFAVSEAGAAGVCDAGLGPKGFYDFSVKNIEGKDTKLDEYRGRVALVVNTASRCGFTKQYAGLQALYDKYKDRGFVVLGFPSNDFGKQEPGTNKEIKDFCEVNFNVKFPLFDKGSVRGASKQAVYKFLTEDAGESYKGEIKWNFEKFLIDSEGQVIGRYGSRTKPEDADLVKKLASALPKTETAVKNAAGC